jgi:glycosyltransferase involved in cell wall biosynthesis
MTEGSTRLAVSVLIPTHNPRADYLARVIDALREQTMSKDLWELVIVDNGSRAPLVAEGGPRDYGTTGPQATEVDLTWHANARIVREERLGLTFARLRGFAEAKGELIVMVDDDNVLAPDYLETAVRIAEEHPMLGAFGGKCLPEFEVEPEEWLASVRSGLGLRDLGEAPQLFPEETGGGGQETGDRSQGAGTEDSPKANTRQETGRVTRRVMEFPDCAPIGAGMVLRRDAAAAYAKRIEQRTTGLRDHGTKGLNSEDGGQISEHGKSPSYRNTDLPQHRAAAVITDRRGDSLASGGDNDICLTVVEEGWQVGYLPQLQLTHLIPKRRMTLDYQRRMARDSMKSYILMLDQHGIRPWPAMAKWTLPLRVASDWWRVKPWRGTEQTLRFWGHVGMYEGRAALRSSAAASSAT